MRYSELSEHGVSPEHVVIVQKLEVRKIPRMSLTNCKGGMKLSFVILNNFYFTTVVYVHPLSKLLQMNLLLF